MHGLKRGLGVVDDIEGRRMLKIGEVSRRSGVGVEARCPSLEGVLILLTTESRVK